jgi:glutamate racemase
MEMKKDVQNSILSDFYNKSEVTILITDSGLGGLYVCARLEKEFSKQKIFRKVNLVYCNALPDSSHLYNNFKTDIEKVYVFNGAINGMVKLYKPDLVLIACNTLSAIFSQTEFSRISTTPVYGIIDFGVDLINDRMEKEPNSDVLILGTETTISSKAHLNKLVEKGISPERIKTQACKYLETEIQNDPESDVVENMIQLYIDEALNGQTDLNKKMFVCLCCTHYSYSKNVFKRILQNRNLHDFQILDPNDRMSEFFFESKTNNHYASTKTMVEVVSRMRFTESEVTSISNIIEKISSKTSTALKHYRLNKELFGFNQP